MNFSQKQSHPFDELSIARRNLEYFKRNYSRIMEKVTSNTNSSSTGISNINKTITIGNLKYLAENYCIITKKEPSKTVENLSTGLAEYYDTPSSSKKVLVKK